MFDAAQGFVGYMALNEKVLGAMDWQIHQNKPYGVVLYFRTKNSLVGSLFSFLLHTFSSINQAISILNVL